MDLESFAGKIGEQKRVEQDRQRVELPCFVCGARGDERHDGDEHRAFARESRTY